MSKANVKRFLNFASRSYRHLAIEEPAKNPEEKKSRKVISKPSHQSRIPAILAINKQLLHIKEQIRELESQGLRSTTRFDELKQRYEKIDSLLMEKLKEE